MIGEVCTSQESLWLVLVYFLQEEDARYNWECVRVGGGDDPGFGTSMKELCEMINSCGAPHHSFFWRKLCHSVNTRSARVGANGSLWGSFHWVLVCIFLDGLRLHLHCGACIHPYPSWVNACCWLNGDGREVDETCVWQLYRYVYIKSCRRLIRFGIIFKHWDLKSWCKILVSWPGWLHLQVLDTFFRPTTHCCEVQLYPQLEVINVPGMKAGVQAMKEGKCSSFLYDYIANLHEAHQDCSHMMVPRKSEVLNQNYVSDRWCCEACYWRNLDLNSEHFYMGVFAR